MPQHTVTAAVLSFLHDTPTLLSEFLCPQVKLLDNFNTSQHGWSLDAQDLEISNLGRHMATSGGEPESTVLKRDSEGLLQEPKKLFALASPRKACQSQPFI